MKIHFGSPRVPWSMQRCCTLRVYKSYKISWRLLCIHTRTHTRAHFKWNERKRKWICGAKMIVAQLHKDKDWNEIKDASVCVCVFAASVCLCLLRVCMCVCTHIHVLCLCACACMCVNEFVLRLKNAKGKLHTKNWIAKTKHSGQKQKFQE